MFFSYCLLLVIECSIEQEFLPVSFTTTSLLHPWHLYKSMHSVNEWINFSLPTFILTSYVPRLRELHVDSYSRTLSLLSYWSYSFSIINFLSLQDIQQMSLFLMATSPQISPILQEIIKIQCKKTCLVKLYDLIFCSFNETVVYIMQLQSQNIILNFI